jgi:hypothetical protein
MQKVLLQGKEYLVDVNGEIFNSRHHKMKPYVDKVGGSLDKVGRYIWEYV